MVASLPHDRDRLAAFLDTTSVRGGVDYHIHSTYSDGALTPGELVAHVIENDLSAFALTDHDTMAGVGEVLGILGSGPSSARGEGADGTGGSSPLFVPGVEISVMLDNREIHVLGYFTEPDPGGIADYFADQAKNRERRNLAMIEKLRTLGYDISMDDLMLYGKEKTLPGRVHMALWLVDHGVCRSVSGAFQQLLGEGKPAFVHRTRRSIEEAFHEIDRAGGLSVIAHPQQYGWTGNPDDPSAFKKLYSRFEYLAKLGLRGIECFHGKAGPEEMRLLAGVASELGLIRTAGSDFHGRSDHHAPMYDGKTSFSPFVSAAG